MRPQTYAISQDFFQFFMPQDFDGEYAQMVGSLKTAEISLESALQTCLGESFFISHHNISQDSTL